jgi:hypothetical protein
MRHKLTDIISDANLKKWTQLSKTDTSENLTALLDFLDKPMYTYCLIDDTLILAEVKPENDIHWSIYDEYSKHALICNSNSICVSGIAKKTFDGGKIEFDNISGTYKPSTSELQKLDKFKSFFPEHPTPKDPLLSRKVESRFIGGQRPTRRR